MHNLKTSYEVTIVCLKSYHKKIIAIILKKNSLKLHFQTIFKDSNLFTSHIFCLNETRIKNIQTHQLGINAISNKFLHLIML
jgi:hypothetical protein